MSLDKSYSPSEHEDKIYQLWEEKGALKPNPDKSKGSFSMVIPPPNANGDLHMGHGLTMAIEDIGVRYNRMLGKSTLFVPGADHAGFETQTVYERQLAEQGKSRFDFSREELYKQIWDFVELNKNNYQSQLRRLGASLSWDDFVYTLDQNIVDTAYSTFKKMWEEGLIYRGERLVNYCTHHGTGFADIEVEYQENQGHIWSIKYLLTDGSGEIVVATTRPETMLGDTAVAVHPDDDRYKDFVGKTIKLPLTEREIPIITDEHVDINFGTGAVKITPAHDPNDYEIGARHDLPMISVIGHDGLINHNAPEAYRGMDVKDARSTVVNDLESSGALAEVKSHINNVGHCYKCGTVIEPLLTEQWFVDMKPLTEKAINALKGGEIEFYPENRKTQLIEYLENLRDWNISRQIAWGIPIPAFQNADNPDDWIFDTRVDQHILEIDGKTYHRDPDVFDTWFSSSSWPYATLDYPDGDKYKEYYPLSVMETGFDILYPWVSRMIMLGLYVTGQVPFKKVYLHGLIQDEHGAKMSKSKGNVINPMEKIDQFGSDAFRMGIIADESPASSRPYDESKVVGARNFCNKIWNIARYAEGALGEELKFGMTPEPKTVADHWILARLSDGIEKIGKNLGDYRFSEAYNSLYHLIWDDLADWYVEASKGALNTSVLSYSLETVLKLAHPFAPFVTEAIYQNLATNPAPASVTSGEAQSSPSLSAISDLTSPETSSMYNEGTPQSSLPGRDGTDSSAESADSSNLLMLQRWPTSPDYDQNMANDLVTIQSIVTEVRGIQTGLKIHKGVLAHGGDEFISQHAELIQRLAKLDRVEKSENREGIVLSGVKNECWYVIDPETAKKLADSLNQDKSDLETQINRLEGRLSNSNYVDKAPKELVDQTRAELDSAQAELAKITDQISKLS